MCRSIRFCAAALIAAVAALVCVRPLYAEPPVQPLTLPDGREVLLRGDGSWRFRGFADFPFLTLPDAPSLAAVDPEDLIEGRVVEVVDGETLLMQFQDAPFPLQGAETVTLAGVEAPALETMELFAFESRRDLAGLLPDRVALAFDTPLRDETGRLSAFVLLPSGQWANAAVLERGLARHAPGSVFSAELAALEERARTAGVGLWSGMAKKVYIKEVFNASATEYVEVANASEETVDLSGWYLFGEAGHTVALPFVRLRPSESVRIYTGPTGRHEPPEAYHAVAREIWKPVRETIRLVSPDGTLVDLFRY